MSPPTRQSPLHERVKRQLSEAIALGHWPAGHVIPGEAALARDFAVGVGTMRRALADLVAEGQLSRQPKRGTVVTGRAPLHSLRFFYQYFRLHGADGSLLRSQIEMLSLRRRPSTAPEAERLQLAPGAMLIDLQRLRLVEGRPAMLDDFRISAERAPDFPVQQEAAPALIYQHLLERNNIRLSAVREELRAVLAKAEQARLLGLGTPAALLCIDSVAYDQAGLPFLLCTHHAPTERCVYVNEVR
ncbi:GntR family transcriptional regulator [Pseudoroseomonas cervicalis]|uniref:GntR family transcriptional regulator n=1 Tax=Teichococcus cervicalis TaxID=204525 RepID=UPI0022F1C7D0|nr:GntR family transcriptional regulator [Pseudoroseomonas cervicalis]WBV45013.1 GntR family transcriptional regulator [Pseudoroseomonas cervicalis]